MVRRIAAVLLILVAALGFFAWRKYSAPPPPSVPAESNPSMPQSAEPPASATAPAAGGPGVDWTVPTAWVTGPPRPMRLASYAAGDAECAVFYFGPNQGGEVDANIDRWAGQFQGSPKPKREVLTIKGMNVTRVEIEGTFLSPGSDMQSQGSKPVWRLLGAIVQGPQGPIFFKLTGPAAAVKGAAKDFDTLLASLTAH